VYLLGNVYTVASWALEITYVFLYMFAGLDDGYDDA
jgi:hypothetical protein